MPPFPAARNRPARAGGLLPSFVEAVVTMLAALATLLCTQAFAPGAGTAVLAVVLSLSLARSQLDRDLRGRLEAAVVLPLVALLALGVGLLLRHLPWLGAAVFVAGMSMSVWLRRFGAMARRAASLIALPLVTLLTVPHVHASRTGGLPAVLVPVAIALLALLWVTVFHAIAGRLGSAAPPDVVDAAAAPPATAEPRRLAAPARMAVQMAVALSLAFVVGFALFAERWAWIVLTAFIVNSGNRGRLDVLYKSGMRVVGAAAGTVAALLFSLHLGLGSAGTGALILTALFLGVWLRPFAYAWWALFVTVALALLQGFDGGAPSAMLWQRLEEIAIGAVVGVAAAWFVLPVRSTDVMRRRLADVLAALAEALDPATPSRNAARFNDALDQLALVTPPFKAVRRLTRRTHPQQPADWADALLACRAGASALIQRGATPATLRQAVGAARKALREPASLTQALQHLHAVLEQTSQATVAAVPVDASTRNA